MSRAHRLSPSIHTNMDLAIFHWLLAYAAGAVFVLVPSMPIMDVWPPTSDEFSLVVPVSCARQSQRTINQELPSYLPSGLGKGQLVQLSGTLKGWVEVYWPVGDGSVVSGHYPQEFCCLFVAVEEKNDWSLIWWSTRRISPA